MKVRKAPWMTYGGGGGPWDSKLALTSFSLAVLSPLYPLFGNSVIPIHKQKSPCGPNILFRALAL